MRKILVVAAIAAVVFAVVWAVVNKDSYSWHQKLTITVETPAGEVSGSSVSAVS